MASLSYTDDPILDKRFANAKKRTVAAKPTFSQVVGGGLKDAASRVGQDVADIGSGIAGAAGGVVDAGVNLKNKTAAALKESAKTSGSYKLGEGLREATDMAKAVPGIVQEVGDATLGKASNALSYAMTDVAEGFSAGEPSLAQAPVSLPANTPVQDVAAAGTPGVNDPTVLPNTGEQAVPVGGGGETAVGLPRGSAEYATERERVNTIRGTQQETSSSVGLGSVGGVGGGDSDYVVYSGEENTADNRALAKADEIRRNVFHRTYDSDAVKIARQEGANKAADSYYKEKTGNAVDKQRIAATKQVGLANVDARMQEANLVAQTARQAGLHGTAPTAPDYDNELKRMEYEDESTYRASKAAVAKKYAKHLAENGEFPQEYFDEMALLDSIRGEQ